MDNIIKVTVRKTPEGRYVGKVTVNGEFYASVNTTQAETAMNEAIRYATQIEFDEDGNW